MSKSTTMRLVIRPKTYSSANVLHIVYDEDTQAKQNATDLGKAWIQYKYPIKDVNEFEIGVVDDDQDQSSENALSWFKDWLQEIGVTEPSKANKLVIVCYFGHGGIDDDNHLIGSGEGDAMQFSITMLQEWARDNVHADVLFILECCHGDHDGMTPLDSSEQASDDMIMETLAACEGETKITTTDDDFTRRFASNLLSFREPYSVVDREDEITDRRKSEEEWNTGYRRQDAPSRFKEVVSIVLQPLV